MEKHVEAERKLVSLANTQFKFSLIADQPRVTRDVKLLCSFIGIDSGSVMQHKITDTYYDDDVRTLGAAGCSIRQRLMNGRSPRVTFKAGKKFSSSSALERDEVEFECTPEEFNEMRDEDFTTRLQEAFGGTWCATAPCGALATSLVVHNNRTSFPIQTKESKYEFCFDKFYFEAPDGTFSEFFAEIEVETVATSALHDQAIDKLMEGLCELLDFETHRTSKYKRGIGWLKNKGSDYTIVHSLMIDIIGYSLRSADVQKQMIQKLNRFAKEALRRQMPLESVDIVCIPTGDGMILVFERNPAALLPLLFDVQDKVRQHSQVSPDLKFEFRAGLHSGPVFKFSDINERLNYAGSGINMAQRAMVPGKAWHVLATRDSREHVVNANGALQGVFHTVKEKLVTKHGEELVIYNIYDDMGHGNPEDPTIR